MYSSRQYLQSKKILEETARNLLRKNLVPQHTKGLFVSPQAMHAAIHNYIMEPIKEYTCPVCQITIKCPMEWIRAHHKTHFKRDFKENEQNISKIHPYYK